MTFVYLAVGAFCIGLYGVLTRRDIIGVLASIEVVLGSATLLMVGLAATSGAAATSTGAGVLGAAGLVILVLAAAEAAVGLALLFTVAKRIRTSSLEDLQEVRG